MIEKRTTMHEKKTYFETALPMQIVKMFDLLDKDKIVWNVDDDGNITVTFERKDRSDEWE